MDVGCERTILSLGNFPCHLYHRIKYEIMVKCMEFLVRLLV